MSSLSITLLALSTSLGCGVGAESAAGAAPSSAKPATLAPANAAAKPEPALAPGGATASPTASPTAKSERASSATARGGQDEGGQDKGGQDEGGQDKGGQDKGGQDKDAVRGAAPPPAGEPRAERFADLETLCAALNRDYVDGTLTDYYHDLTMKTDFGEDLRRRGEESMKPGRILKAGRDKLGENAGDPHLPACAQLFDELDDLE